MKIDLGDDANLKTIIAEAVLASVDVAKRDALLKAAMTHLLAPQEPIGQWGKPRPSPLEEAYKDAIDHHARRMAFEMFENDETAKTQLRTVLTEAVERAFVTHREATVERVANAIAEGLWKRDT